jgi:hypothetical protein
MDGYSVNEAAAVLGIPEGRVWELLARGVLSGSSEVGGDMRVFLRGTTVPTPVPEPEGGVRNGGNGNGDHGELSPFRELLTEFRNLTERYGQALLALGEARGEVASLRGRVELLEARIEHRLAFTEAPTSPWVPADEAAAETAQEPAVVTADVAPEPFAPEPPAAEPVEPAPEPHATAQTTEIEPLDEPDVLADVLDATLGGSPMLEPLSEPVPDSPIEATYEPEVESRSEPPAEAVDADDAAAESASEPTAETPRHRQTSTREAISGFAAALARAQDPATDAVGADFEELPGSQETADAIAAYRLETEFVAAEPATIAEETGEDEAAEQAPTVAAAPEGAPSTDSGEEDEAKEPPVSIIRPGYSTDTPEPDWIAEEDLIVSTGENIVTAETTVPAEAIAPAQEVSPDGDDEPPVPAADEPRDDLTAYELVPDEPIADEAPEPMDGLEDPGQAAALLGALEHEPEVDWGSSTGPDVATLHAVPMDQPGTQQLEEREPPLEVMDADRFEPELDPEPNPTPVDIAAEPPAPDDEALIAAAVAFSEPPIVPPEPAFWEPGARSRAPFAMPHQEPWDAAPPVPMATDVQRPAPEPAKPKAERAGPARSRPGLSSQESGPSEPPPLSPAAMAGRAAAARQRPRGPAARAIRRLRYLLD